MFFGQFGDSTKQLVKQMDAQPGPFAVWLDAARQAKGFGVRQLATYLGVSHSHLSMVLKGKAKPGSELALKAAEYFRVPPNRLLTMLSGEPYPTADIPSSTLLDTATGLLMLQVVEQEAGAGGGVETVDTIYLPPTIVPPNHRLAAIRVRGDCMSPRIEDSDIAVVDRDAEWIEGRVVLADVEGRLLVKRFYREDHQIRLATDNPDYQDVYTTEAAILGVVIQVVKRM